MSRPSGGMPYEIPDDKKTPVTVITGFLGAGKTTLLNYILTTNHGMKFAVVENEFGEIGIDTDLVTDKKFMAEEIVSMDNGCLCCTVREDLVKSIRQLLSLEKKFDGIIIETTGMADPAPVVQTFYQNEDLRRRCRVDGVITVVDSKHCREHLFKVIEKGEGQDEVVNECMQQVAFADRILLNKTDLVTAEELIQLKHDLTTVNKLADAYECQRGQVDPALLININQFSLEKALDFDPEFLKEKDHGHSHGEHGHSHGDGKDHSNCDHDEGKCEHDHGHGHGHAHGKDDKDHSKCDHDKGKCEHGHGHGEEKKEEHSHCHGHSHGEKKEEHSHGHGHSHGEKKFKPQTRHDMAVSSVGVKLEPGQDMNLGQLQNWIGELVQVHGESLYRYKGIISVKGFDEKFVFQGVHMLFDGNFMGEWTEPDGQRISKFVFIGKFAPEPTDGKTTDAKGAPLMTRKYLEQGFKDCIAKPLRFAVGTVVEARVKGGFKKGTIIKQWDHGNPYRIKLEETGIEVYGPMDDDRVVRKIAE